MVEDVWNAKVTLTLTVKMKYWVHYYLPIMPDGFLNFWKDVRCTLLHMTCKLIICYIPTIRSFTFRKANGSVINDELFDIKNEWHIPPLFGSFEELASDSCERVKSDYKRTFRDQISIFIWKYKWRLCLHRNIPYENIKKALYSLIKKTLHSMKTMLVIMERCW